MFTNARRDSTTAPGKVQIAPIRLGVSHHDVHALASQAGRAVAPKGVKCTDMDECALHWQTHKCDLSHADSECTNSAGSFICSCHPGWKSSDRGVM
eukprot:887151-Rhodomonas_salina.2